jgi:threonine/homoserine/homoserine lactone efflux protein
MSLLDREELIGLAVLLVIIVGLTLVGKLTPTAVDAIKWVGGTFFAALGAKNILPGSKT